MTPLQLGSIIPQNPNAVPCFVEDFSNGLVPYTLQSGSAAIFSVASGTYGQTLTIATQNSLTQSIERRLTSAVPALNYTCKFNVLSNQSDDACAAQFLSSGANAFSFNPRREGASDPNRRPQLIVGTESLYLGNAGDVALNTWYQLDVNCIAGAGNSRYWVTRLSDGVVVISGYLSNDHTGSSLVDNLQFVSDANGPTCPTAYADVEACPAFTFGTAQFFDPNAIMTWTSTYPTLSTYTGSTPGGNFAFYGDGISDRSGNKTMTLSDKRYFEVTCNGPKNVGLQVWFAKFATANGANPISNTPTLGGWFGANHGGVAEGILTNGGSVTTNSNYVVANGDVLGIAIDGTTGNLFMSKNGVYPNSQNPFSGSSPALTLSQLTSINLLVSSYDTPSLSACGATIALGQDCKYFPPVGYKYWNRLT